LPNNHSHEKKSKNTRFLVEENPKKYSFQFSIFSVDPNPSTGGKK
jgi:type II restriction/modification system DNA methylase subunit YeeA